MATKTDVLIIGGGSIGLNSAYYLQKAGREVTILDRAAIGVGSSAGNAGHIVPSHIIPLATAGMVPQTIKWLLYPNNSPFSMRFSLDPNYLWWLARFALNCTQNNTEKNKLPLDQIGKLSYDNFRSIIEQENISCSYARSGLLFLYTTEGSFKAGIHEGDYMSQNGIPVSVYDRAAVKQAEPLVKENVLGGVHYTGDASLHPAVYLREIKQIVSNNGALLREYENVIKIEVSGGKITRIITDKDEYMPESVVLSAGAWSPQLQREIGISIPIQPAKGYSVTYQAPSVLPQHALLLGEKKIAITPLGDQLRFTGRLELSALEQNIEQKKIDDISSAVHDYLNIDPTPVIETWAGLRPTTPDGVPIIGSPAKIQNLVIAAGHAMLGLSLGPGTGELVSRLVAGSQPNFDLSPFSPERF